MRRRRDERARAGLTGQLRILALGAYHRTIGLDLDDIAIDGCIRRGPLRRADGRAQPGRPRQGRAQTLPTVRWGRHLDGHRARPANRRDHQLLPATLDALKDVEPLPEVVSPPRCQLRRQAVPRRTGPAGPGLVDLQARHPRPGRQAVGGRGGQLLAERLRQAAPLHRTQPDRCAGLPRPGRRHRHRACPHPRRLEPLPLGRPVKITTHPPTYRRTALPRPASKGPGLTRTTLPSRRPRFTQRAGDLAPHRSSPHERSCPP